MGFSRQEYWSGLPFPSSGDLPDPGIEPTSLLSHMLADRFFTTSTTCEMILINKRSSLGLVVLVLGWFPVSHKGTHMANLPDFSWSPYLTT